MKITEILKKVVLIIFVSLPILFISYILSIIAMLALRSEFYVLIILAGAVCLIITVILRTFNLVNPKLIKKVAGLFLLICVGAIAICEVDLWLDESKIIREPYLSHNDYQPFAPDNKVAVLNEAATLTITGDLPKLDGATALYPLYAAFAQATYPKKEYYSNGMNSSEVVCNTTTYAYSRLINGEADIIFAARPSQKQLAMAAQKGVELKLTPIGREAFVFFVNVQNNVDNLSIEQIQGVYTGEITDWRQVGGNKNEKIRAYQRPDNSGSQTMLQKLMEGKNLMTPPKENVMVGMGEIISQAAVYRNYNNAIGYSFYFFATIMAKNDQIRLLKVNGVYPDKNTIKNKTYPLVSDFYAVTAGSKNPNVEPFINWILSPQGQYLIEATGYAALPER